MWRRWQRTAPLCAPALLITTEYSELRRKVRTDCPAVLFYFTTNGWWYWKSCSSSHHRENAFLRICASFLFRVGLCATNGDDGGGGNVWCIFKGTNAMHEQTTNARISCIESNARKRTENHSTRKRIDGAARAYSPQSAQHMVDKNENKKKKQKPRKYWRRGEKQNPNGIGTRFTYLIQKHVFFTFSIYIVLIVRVRSTLLSNLQTLLQTKRTFSRSFVLLHIVVVAAAARI